MKRFLLLIPLLCAALSATAYGDAIIVEPAARSWILPVVLVLAVVLVTVLVLRRKK